MRDAVTVALAVLILWWLTARAGESAAWEADIARFVADLPSWLSTLAEAVYFFGALWVVGGVAIAALVARRARLARDLIIGGLAAWIIGRALALLSGRSTNEDLLDLITSGRLPPFPMVRIGVMTAMVATAAPYLVRPLRHVGWWVIGISAMAGLLVPAGVVTDVVGAVVVGLGVAAAVHLAFGSPQGRPTVGQISDGLRRLGVTAAGLHLAPTQPWGVVVVEGDLDDGRRLIVKAYGEDANDASLLSRMWRLMWFRNTELDVAKSAITRVNDEALVTLLARRAGVPVPDIITTGAADSEPALLAVAASTGTSLAELPAAEITDGLLDSIWGIVVALHGSRLSHGCLDPLHVVVSPGGVQLIDFAQGESPARLDSMRIDLAVLLVSTGLLVGAERAVAAALRTVDADEVVSALAYLQAPALPQRLRDRVRAADRARPLPAEDDEGAKRAPKLLDSLRVELIAATGAESPEAVQLQRITLKQILIVAGTAFAAWMLLSQLGDPAAMIDTLKTATWWFVGAGFLLALVPAFTDAIAARSALPQDLPIGPIVILQYSQKFTNLAIPSTVGVAAVTTAFFAKQGVPLATALSSGLLVSVGGFVVQMLVVIVSLIATGGDLSGATAGGHSGIVKILVFSIIIGGIALAVVMLRPTWRKRVLVPVRHGLKDMAKVLTSPRKFFRIVGGNLASQLLYAMVLGLSLHAYGESLTLPQLLLINTGTTFITGVVPVPGGMGVAEASLAAGMTAYGVPPEIAAAAAITHRLVTFYIPPIYGWFAFRWLNKHDYL